MSRKIRAGRFLNKIVFALTIVNGFFIILAGVCQFISPERFVMLQYFGISFPIFFLLNLLFIFYWWFQSKLALIIPLCLLIFSLFLASKYLQFTREKPKAQNALRIGTLNAQLFGNHQKRNFIDSAVRIVNEENLDVFCIQEFFVPTNLEENLIGFKSRIHAKYYKYFPLFKDKNYGMVIFSKYRIINTGEISFDEVTGNMAGYVDLKREKDTIRVFNLHLQSFRFKRQDYAFVEGKNSNNTTFSSSKNILKRMNLAYIKRSRQADIVAEHIKKSPFPVLVLGDFNDVPLSYTYNIICGQLMDAFRVAGNGLEKTYTGPFPSFRIDYILYSNLFNCISYKSHSRIPSDHKFVYATLVEKSK